MFIDFIIGIIINSMNIEIKIIDPIKPNCSAKIENTKSVSFSGIKSKLDCEPPRKPLPLVPPDPIAILDCII